MHIFLFPRRRSHRRFGCVWLSNSCGTGGARVLALAALAALVVYISTTAYHRHRHYDQLGLAGAFTLVWFSSTILTTRKRRFTTLFPATRLWKLAVNNKLKPIVPFQLSVPNPVYGRSRFRAHGGISPREMVTACSRST